jgi:hypothetical protein
MARPRASRRSPPAELAVIHNELARARFDRDLGVVALRLMLMLAEKVGYNDDELMGHRFKVSEYAERLGLRGSGGSAYERLEATCDRLMKTLVTTRRSFGERVKFQVMKRATYLDGEGEVELEFHEDMKPLLLKLRDYFARIPLEVFFRIKGTHAARLYLMCKSWDPHDRRNGKPGWDWTVAQLREWLALRPEEYPHTFHLNRSLLARAKQELDEVVDVSFRYTPHKDGKAIAGFHFVPVVNRPKCKALAGRRRRRTQPESPPSEPDKALDLEPMKRLWAEASEEQRQVWLAADDLLRRLAPEDGKPPRMAFLARLHSLTQPTEAAA